MTADKKPKPGADGMLLKLYRKFRASGMKHMQAYEAAAAQLAAPKEKKNERKKKREREPKQAKRR